MPIFMIERNFAERLKVTPEGAATINEINDQESARWLISFLSVDKKKTFCLYEAPSVEEIREAARRAGIPADAIVELGEEIVPSGAMNPLRIDRYAKSDPFWRIASSGSEYQLKQPDGQDRKAKGGGL